MVLGRTSLPRKCTSNRFRRGEELAKEKEKNIDYPPTSSVPEKKFLVRTMNFHAE